MHATKIDAMEKGVPLERSFTGGVEVPAGMGRGKLGGRLIFSGFISSSILEIAERQAQLPRSGVELLWWRGWRG